MTVNRSTRPDVRNPLAGDPEVAAIVAELMAEHPEAAEALRLVLRRLAVKWRAEAQKAWDKHKSPIGRYNRVEALDAWDMAVRLKAATVYSGHLARMIK